MYVSNIILYILLFINSFSGCRELLHKFFVDNLGISNSQNDLVAPSLTLHYFLQVYPCFSKISELIISYSTVAFANNHVLQLVQPFSS